MDAGAGDVERPAHERVVVRDRQADRPHVVGQLGDRQRVDAAQAALEGDVLEDRAFQRRVAGPLAEAEQRGVEGVAAVEPGGGAVDVHLVEVVVAVPFEPVARARRTRGSACRSAWGCSAAAPRRDS